MRPSLFCLLCSSILGAVLAGRPSFIAKQPTFYRDPTLSALPRGGDIPSGGLNNVFNKVKSFLWETPPPEPAKSENIWKKAGNYFEKQTSAAKERREYYQEHAGQVQHYAKNVLKPVRILQLTLVAVVMAELVEFIAGNQSLQSFWTGTLRPALMGRLSQIKVWWSKGRGTGGLFNGETWSQARQKQKPQIIIKAWNQQFSPKYQRAMGLAVGLILSPVLWSLTSVAAPYVGALGAGIAVAELNHYVGERIQDLLEPLSLPLSQGWSGIDQALEQVRGRFWDFVKKPVTVVQKSVKDLDERVPDELVPVPVQQGILVGALLGFCCGI